MVKIDMTGTNDGVVIQFPNGIEVIIEQTSDTKSNTSGILVSPGEKGDVNYTNDGDGLIITRLRK